MKFVQCTKKFLQNNLPLSEINILWLIAAFVFFTHSPVLFHDYLRQDDWSAGLWLRFLGTKQCWLEVIHFKKPVNPWACIANIQTHPGTYNSAVELFRPVSTAIFLAGDAIAYNIGNIWIVRSYNIALLCIAAVFTYSWLRRLKADSLFAACFTITSFALPAYQVQASTANYTIMIVSIILGQISFFLWHEAYHNSDKKSLWQKYRLAYFVMLASLLCYPMSSPYPFLFLAIYVLLLKESIPLYKNRKIIDASIFILLCMISVITLGRLVIILFHIHPQNIERSVNIDWDIPNKIYHWTVMLQEASNLFDINGMIYKEWRYVYYPVITILGLFFVADYIDNKKHFKDFSKKQIIIRTIFDTLAILALMTLAYCPALAPHTILIVFRYTVIIMPIMLFLLMWSIKIIINHWLHKENNQVFKIFLVLFTAFAVITAMHNHTLYIVGQNEYQLNFMRGFIESDALPVLKEQKPVTIHIIRDPRITILPNNLRSDVYGMGVSPEDFAWGLYAAIIYLMRDYGYESIEVSPTFKWQGWNSKMSWGKVKWGTIIVTEKDYPLKDYPLPDTGEKVVTIDMTKLGTYK
ncbi:MAG: hypothetical protein WCJ72_17085 [Chryseobacterium sp.]